MALIPSFLHRSTSLLLMPDAILRGLTPTAFIRELTSLGLSYRRTTMLSDWRNVSGTEARKDVIKYVRKDRLLSARSMAEVDWDMRHKYMYQFSVWMEGEPLGKKAKIGVNIMSDEPLTPKQAEGVFWERWKDVERYGTAMPSQIKLTGAWHKATSLDEPTPSPFPKGGRRE